MKPMRFSQIPRNAPPTTATAIAPLRQAAVGAEQDSMIPLMFSVKSLTQAEAEPVFLEIFSKALSEEAAVVAPPAPIKDPIYATISKSISSKQSADAKKRSPSDVPCLAPNAMAQEPLLAQKLSPAPPVVAKAKSQSVVDSSPLPKLARSVRAQANLSKIPARPVTGKVAPKRTPASNLKSLQGSIPVLGSAPQAKAKLAPGADPQVTSMLSSPSCLTLSFNATRTTSTATCLSPFAISPSAQKSAFLASRES